MSNLLNAIISKQTVNPKAQDKIPAFTFDSDGKTKPAEYKGKLLPSRIIGSPVEYVKDLKKDVISIGRAAKGKANDHELGRINDLAMKMGSFALATYLFIKNPLKLNKAMEFAGFTTFFTSMALWPKLAIQLPLKLRTGVDIHQKYIDSQGRKKMLFQDPQYDLTDLYSREDLDMLGNKLKVNKNLPDRDNFIKQRAKKTAVQGNTLWMMTAGFATPLMSALGCNLLEKPIGKAIESYDIISSTLKLNRGVTTGPISNLKQTLADNSLRKFLQKNADRVMDESFISELSSKLGKNSNSAVIIDAIKDEISSLKRNVKIDEQFIKEVLSGVINEDTLNKLNDGQKTLLNQAMEEGSSSRIADILIDSMQITKKHDRIKLNKNIVNLLDNAKKSKSVPVLRDITDKINIINNNIKEFAAEKNLLDKYISAKIGDKSGTYIANQWSRVGNKFVKLLKLSDKELKLISEGNMDILTNKLSSLASSDVEYDNVIKELLDLINDYEAKTGSTFVSKIKQKSNEICTKASNNMNSNGLEKLAKRISSEVQKGTLENSININAQERITGAQSSFYRLIQSLDLFKRIKSGKLERQLAEILKAEGREIDKEQIKKLTDACQNVILNATTTDYVEKLRSSAFNLSEFEYKTVMRVLFDNGLEDDVTSSLQQSLTNCNIGIDRAKEMLEGYRKYKDEVMNKIANWQNNITPELSRRTVSGVTNSANAVERNSLAGKSIKNYIQDLSKQVYNSHKWLKIFGISMAVLTAVTLIAGLAIGRKSKMEKQVEEESKKNG